MLVMKELWRHAVQFIIPSPSNVCIRDLDKFYLIWWFGFKLKPILANKKAVPKMLLTIKVVKSEPKMIILILFPKFSQNPRNTR